MNWECYIDEIYNSHTSFRSIQDWIEMSVGPAHYRIIEIDTGWNITWWHGNRGHDLGTEKTLEDAKEKSRKHLFEMITKAKRINNID